MDYTKNNNISLAEEINKDSIFIWIDILGFSKDLKNRNKYSELRVVLESFRKIFTINRMIQSVISDGILLEIPYDVHLWNVSIITQYFNEISKGQLRMIIEHEKLIRGGIAIGMPISEVDRKRYMYISDELAKAYRTKSKECVNPVIGINPNELENLKQLTGADNNENFGLEKDCVKKREIYYLDFMRNRHNETNNVDRVLKFVNNNLSRCDLHDTVRCKYIWLYEHINHYETSSR